MQQECKGAGAVVAAEEREETMLATSAARWDTGPVNAEVGVVAAAEVAEAWHQGTMLATSVARKGTGPGNAAVAAAVVATCPKLQKMMLATNVARKDIGLESVHIFNYLPFSAGTFRRRHRPCSLRFCRPLCHHARRNRLSFLSSPPFLTTT
mmetsp:Transcript_32357/g.52789  ORF Transcript_32357/g.52789 Transcript_32357/m.52789 type:complete len:152 (-) Transcript_32357:2-457(-)